MKSSLCFCKYFCQSGIKWRITAWLLDRLMKIFKFTKAGCCVLATLDHEFSFDPSFLAGDCPPPDPKTGAEVGRSDVWECSLTSFSNPSPTATGLAPTASVNQTKAFGGILGRVRIDSYTLWLVSLETLAAVDPKYKLLEGRSFGAGSLSWQLFDLYDRYIFSWGFAWNICRLAALARIALGFLVIPSGCRQVLIARDLTVTMFNKLHKRS